MKLALATFALASSLFSSMAHAGFCPAGETSIQFFGKVANAQKTIDLTTGATVCTFQVAVKMTPRPPLETPECPLFREDAEQLTLIDRSCALVNDQDISGVLSLTNGIPKLD